MPKECVIGTETQVLCWHCYQIISDFTQPLTQAFQTSLSTYINTITTACKLYVVILTKPLSYPLGYLSAHFETKMRQKRLWHQLPPSLSPADLEYPLEDSPPASPAAYRVMSSPMLSPPSSVHPQHKSLAVKRAGRSTVKQAKIQTACSRQLALASAFITSHFLRHTKASHWAAVARSWRASRCRHTGLQGSRLPQSRQSEVSNEYTCVVCSGEDTGRNRAREEDEYWVNAPSRVGYIPSSPVTMSSAVSLSLACEHKYLHGCHDQDL